MKRLLLSAFVVAVAVLGVAVMNASADNTQVAPGVRTWADGGVRTWA
ncbi:MAG: hypothetical protein KIH63_004515 [Candidatus Saccharibacteria bacterium]|nr:hypothetical protein [Candidatus Saccharibacteria bacterium]